MNAPGSTIVPFPMIILLSSKNAPGIITAASFKALPWYREYKEIPLPKPSTEEEKVYLENLVKNLKDELKAVTD